MVAYESREQDHLPTENAELFGVAFPAYEGGAPLNMDKYAYEVNARKGMPAKPEEIPRIKEKTLKRIEVITEALDGGRKIWDKVDP